MERSFNRAAISASVMLATIMQMLDTTIANVALPHMQGSFSASLDQIEWVLTSYIVAAAIMTPTTGWLTSRFGRKRLLLTSITGFTLASVLCGMAASLPQIVAFRVMQGIFGAALVPMSQAVMLDIYPKERHGMAMALWSTGSTLGPILGPTTGAWLTQNYTWRWVFYINLPLGIIAALGVAIFLSESVRNRNHRLDWFGFATLSLAIGAFQVMLDRGQQLDWFDSPEIVLEAIVAGLSLYSFLVHTFTVPTPFVKPHLFADPNFAVGMILVFAMLAINYATLALMTPFLQSLQGYPVLDAGMLQAPGTIGSAMALMTAGRLVKRIDMRLLVLFGLCVTTFALWRMTGFTGDISQSTFIVTNMIQGVGLGFIMVPLATFTFATLAPIDRPDGTGMFSLVRNLGASIGISVLTTMLTRNIQINHAEIARHVTPTNRLFSMPSILHFWNPTTAGGIASLDEVVTRQATTIAYIDDFRTLMLLTLVTMPLLLFVRSPGGTNQAPAVALE